MNQLYSPLCITICNDGYEMAFETSNIPFLRNSFFGGQIGSPFSGQFSGKNIPDSAALFKTAHCFMAFQGPVSEDCDGETNSEFGTTSWTQNSFDIYWEIIRENTPAYFTSNAKVASHELAHVLFSIFGDWEIGHCDLDTEGCLRKNEAVTGVFCRDCIRQLRKTFKP